MSRENNNTPRERRNEMQKTDAASNASRSSRNDRDNRYGPSRDKQNSSQVTGLDRNSLNDLYERSSV